MEVNTLAEKLQRERHPDSEFIHGRQEAVTQSWKNLTTIAKYREQRLAGSHQIQKFNRFALYTLIDLCDVGMIVMLGMLTRQRVG